MGYYKVGQEMLLCGAGSLLQGGAIGCYKMGQLFSKVNQVLQNGTRANTNWISNFLQLFSIVIVNGGGIKKWDSVITKWDNYFKESK